MWPFIWLINYFKGKSKLVHCSVKEKRMRRFAQKELDDHVLILIIAVQISCEHNKYFDVHMMKYLIRIFRKF